MTHPSPASFRPAMQSPRSWGREDLLPAASGPAEGADASRQPRAFASSAARAAQRGTPSPQPPAPTRPRRVCLSAKPEPRAPPAGACRRWAGAMARASGRLRPQSNARVSKKGLIIATSWRGVRFSETSLEMTLSAKRFI